MPKVAPVTVLMVSYMLARPPFRFVRFENKHLDLMWLDRVGSGWTVGFSSPPILKMVCVLHARFAFQEWACPIHEALGGDMA